MWVFTRYGFFSIACARKPVGGIDTDTVMVRARDDQHLRNLQERFPNTEISAAKVARSETNDYRFRIIIPKAAWVTALSEMATEQTWSNFKNEAGAFARLKKLGGEYVDALHEIWGVMYHLQSRKES